MLEEEALIQGERQLDQVKQQDEDNGEDDNCAGVFVAGRRDGRTRQRSRLAQTQGAAGDEQRKKRRADGKRAEHIGPPAETVISCGFVLVQVGIGFQGLSHLIPDARPLNPATWSRE
jgi:hypothetical protein